MGRAAAIRGRLPTLYAEGAVVGAFTDAWGALLDSLDEAGTSVLRAHRFDEALDLDEVAALAALLDIAPEDFHATLGEFRAWVHALVGARLGAGAVTREALRILVATYLEGFQAAAGIDPVPPVDVWGAPDDPENAALVENPPRLRTARLPVAGGWEPLATMTVRNAGLDPAPWAVVLTGLGAGPEYCPLIADRTSGTALVFRGMVAPGARLTIAPAAADRGRLRADLDGVEVTDRLDVYPTLIPGPDGPGTPDPARPAPRLARGDSELWFLPLAHHDAPGLGRVLLALAEDHLRVARFDQTPFDAGLFAMAPAATARVAWVEREPASLVLRLPGRRLRTLPTPLAAGLAARERLATGLGAALDRTAAAGVATEVVWAAHAERQPGTDRLAGMLPRTVRATAPTGRDHLVASGGLFDVTDFDDSVLT